MTESRDPIDRRLAEALRAVDAEDLDPPAPPADLWADIAAAVEADPAALPEVAAPTAADAPGTPARRRWLLPAAAAVVLVVVALVAGVVVATRDRGRAEVASSAVLDARGLPLKTGAHGRAQLVDEGSDWVLDVDLRDLPAVRKGVVFEVWLMDPASGGLQTLGLTEGRSKLVVPANVDPSRFPVVDVSEEPTDGNPAHSGDSILRGRLRPA